MRDFLRRLDWAVLAILMGIFLLGLITYSSCQAQDAQYLEFPDFTGGLYITRVGKVAPNQASELSNFLIDNGEVRVRDGFGHICQSVGSSPVTFLGMYRKQGTAGKLFMQSGNRIYIVNRVDEQDTVWTNDEYSELFVTTGTVQKGDSNSTYLYFADSTKAMESYAFTSIDLDSTGQTSKTVNVSYAVNDTTLKLATALTENVTGWTYSITASIGTIVSGETFVDSFYMATSTGALRYNDSTLIGTQTQEIIRFIPSSAIYDGNGSDVYYTFSTVLNGSIGRAYIRATSGTAYMKVSLRQVGSSVGILNNKAYYFTYPVREAHWVVANTSIIVRGFKDWFAYDTTGNRPIISLVETQIDPSSAFTVYVDSIIYRHTSIGDGTNGFTVIVDDSLMSGKDSTFFRSGDWFISSGTAITDNVRSQRSAVIGNYLDDSLRVYVTDTWLRNAANPDTISLNTAITFYRRRVASGSTGGYNAAIFWNDRWATVADSTPSQIDFSEDFEPNTASGYFTQVNPDDGEPILWLQQMYGTLIIGKHSSIWKLSGVPGIDDFAQLNRSVDGRSFVAAKSIVSEGNLLFGLGNDGFYVFDYNSMIKISQPIDDLIRDSINWNSVDQIVGGYWDNHFWWSYPSRTSSVNDRTVCYNPTLKAWSTSTLDFRSVLVDKAVNDTASVYLGSADIGKVSLYGTDNDDDGTAISASLRTGWFNMGTDWHEKLVNRFAFQHYRKSATSLSISLLSERPEGAEFTSNRTFSGSLSSNGGFSRLFFPVDQVRGTQFQIYISATTADSLRIGNLGVEYQVEQTGY